MLQSKCCQTSTRHQAVQGALLSNAQVPPSDLENYQSVLLGGTGKGPVPKLLNADRCWQWTGPQTDSWKLRACADAGCPASGGFSHFDTLRRALYQYVRPSGALCSVHSGFWAAAGAAAAGGVPVGCPCCAGGRICWAAAIPGGPGYAPGMAPLAAGLGSEPGGP